LHDVNFFQLSRNTVNIIKRPINLMIAMEKATFADLMQARGFPQSSTFMFQNRESEANIRCRVLRRMSFVLFAGARDEYVEYLPSILEKLSETMKGFSGPYVHIEVLLCMRILLTRTSADYLASFWPLVLTELISVFATVTSARSDGELMIAALKFIDLALVLVPEELAMYRWMFFSDNPEMVPGGDADVKPFTPLLALFAEQPKRVGSDLVSEGFRKPFFSNATPVSLTADGVRSVITSMIKEHKKMFTFSTIDDDAVQATLLDSIAASEEFGSRVSDVRDEVGNLSSLASAKGDSYYRDSSATD